MTIESTTTVKNHTADGMETSFVYDFLVLDEDHITCYLDDVEITGFSVTGVGDAGGGTVEFTSAPASGTLSVVREVPYTQLLDYIAFGKFPAETHETGLDTLTMLIQQVYEIVGRAVLAPRSDGITPLSFILPDKATRALSYLYFDSNGDLTTGTPAGSGDVISSAMQPVVEAASLAAAATAFGIERSGRTAPDTVTLDFSSDADYNLTAANELYGRIVMTDTGVVLTTSRNVVLNSTTKRLYFFQNDTAEQLTLKTSGGSGVAVDAGSKALLYCDGTNVINLIEAATGYSDPLTTNGDIVIRAGGVTTRLGKDTDGKILELSGGLPSWQSKPASGITSVSQGDINTNTQIISDSFSSNDAETSAVSSGGKYVLGADTKYSGSAPDSIRAMMGNHSPGTGYSSRVYLFGPVSGQTSGTAYARFRYITATPPYDLGDGEIGTFAFAIINPDATVKSMSVSVDPPWAHNGPTSIVAEEIDKESGRKYKYGPDLPMPWGAAKQNPSTRDAYLDALLSFKQDRKKNGVRAEITQSVKNADMPLIPNPWHDQSLLPGQSIILLDPVSSVLRKAMELESVGGPTINELVHDGDLIIGNTPLPRATPTGVQAFSVSWR